MGHEVVFPMLGLFHAWEEVLPTFSFLPNSKRKQMKVVFLPHCLFGMKTVVFPLVVFSFSAWFVCRWGGSMCW